MTAISHSLWVRRVLLGLLVVATLAPTVLFLASSALSASDSAWRELAGLPFRIAVKHTLVLALVGSTFAIWIGARLAGALYNMPFWLRRPALALLVLPLLAPPFLSSLGISAFGMSLPYRYHRYFDGVYGSVHTTLCHLIPLTAIAAYFGMKAISKSQREGLILFASTSKGNRVMRRWASPMVWWVTMVGLGYVLFDAGSAQIMGYHGIGSEVLIAFSARYDWTLAGIKLGLSTLAILPPALLLAYLGGRHVRDPICGANSGSASDSAIHPPCRWFDVFLVILAVGLLAILPIWGLIRPLRTSTSFETVGYALSVLRNTAWPTLMSAGLAALLSTILGLAMSLLARHDEKARFFLLVASLVAMAIPSAITGIAWGRLVTAMPASLDFFLRSSAVVGIASGLKLWPVAAIISLYALSRIPRSADESARLAGMSTGRRIIRVVLPPLLPYAGLSALVGAFLALADVGTLLMLQAPGKTTYIGRLLSVLDNASQQTVATLCLLYFGAAVTVVALIVWIGTRILGRTETSA